MEVINLIKCTRKHLCHLDEGLTRQADLGLEWQSDWGERDHELPEVAKDCRLCKYSTC